MKSGTWKDLFAPSSKVSIVSTALYIEGRTSYIDELAHLKAWVYNLPLFVSGGLGKDKDSVGKDKDFWEV